jgi:predicted metalloprotease with PDZ domain
VRDGWVVILSAHRDGPAARAGLSAGDRLVAVDGLHCDESALKAMLARRKPGDLVRVHAFRRDELVEVTAKLAAPQPAITLAARGSNALRNAWIGSHRRAPR